MDQELGTFKVRFLDGKPPTENNRILILGNKVHILSELESYFKDQSLKLIFLDLSQFFPEIDIVLREEFSD
ncbi:MAG: hypothetical protein ACFE8U_10555, partial [Candidatus Hermodarchaeota archaeon]